jgi:hypothetical protein
MGRDEKRRFKPNKKQFWLAKAPAIKERRNVALERIKETQPARA